jgi:hypothetical protein
MQLSQPAVLAGVKAQALLAHSKNHGGRIVLGKTLAHKGGICESSRK